jgi:hypothetical protein
LRFVESSVLDADEILKFAKEREEQVKRSAQAGSFEEAWHLFHDSFAENQDDVCKSLYEGTKNNFNVVGRANLDSAVTVLRTLGRNDLADSLINHAEIHGSNEFWLPDDPFNRGTRDARIKAVADKKAEGAKAVLNFEADLVAAADSMIRDKLAQLAQVPEADYLALFESRSGEQLRRVIVSALDYRRISNASDDMRAVVAKAENALRTIGKRSPLNAVRVDKYGVSTNDEESEKDTDS